MTRMTRILFRLVAMALFFAPIAAHATCSSLSTTSGNSVTLAWGWNNANSAYQPIAENSDCTIGGSGAAVTAAAGAYVDGALVTLGTEADAAYSGSGSATLIAIEKANYAKLLAIAAAQTNGTQTIAGVNGTSVATTANAIPVSTADSINGASASFTRPANTTAYVAGYLVANSTTAGSVTPLTFTSAVRAAGDCVRIEIARLTASSGAITNGAFRLYVFNSAPTVTVGDGAAFDASGVLATNAVDNMAGNFNVSFSYSGSDGAVGFSGPANGSGVTACPTSGTTLYGLLEATAAWTPPSGATMTATLEYFKP
jgi:hypothetical protein